jgi:mannose-6-phosphate isomerase-like protein (cupin superfamily)
MTDRVTFEPGTLAGLSPEAARERVRQDGWDPAVIRDAPGTIYPPHRHPEAKLLGFLAGSMRVHAGGQVYTCGPGDRLVIPGNVEHAAEVGPAGCVFLWSEQVREEQ